MANGERLMKGENTSDGGQARLVSDGKLGRTLRQQLIRSWPGRLRRAIEEWEGLTWTRSWESTGKSRTGELFSKRMALILPIQMLRYTSPRMIPPYQICHPRIQIFRRPRNPNKRPMLTLLCLEMTMHQQQPCVLSLSISSNPPPGYPPFVSAVSCLDDTEFLCGRPLGVVHDFS